MLNYSNVNLKIYLKVCLNHLENLYHESQKDKNGDSNLDTSFKSHLCESINLVIRDI
jgi:hypothetical protein